MYSLKTSFCFVLILTLVSSCVKDTLETTFTYTIGKPVFMLQQAVFDSMKNQSAIALKNPGKMFVSGSYIFLNERNKGIHLINNSNPSKPINESFIPIPGCEDMVVQGQTLYADCYADLMVIDISNPRAVSLKEVIPNLFPERLYGLGGGLDSLSIIVDWIVKDTTIRSKSKLSEEFPVSGGFLFNSPQSFASFSTGSGNGTKSGKAGSMARFALSHEYLYAVTQKRLLALNLSNPLKPNLTSNQSMGWGIETIYPFQDKLFIGSNSGMYIFQLSDPANPKQTAIFTHATVCDPVIADEDYAYVTLRSGMACQGFTNQLDVINIENIYSPKLVRSYPLTNPHGLDKKGNWLFVCDGRDGLKVLDASDVGKVTVKKTIALKDTYDVICWGEVAIVSAAGGIYQFDIKDVNKIALLSQIKVTL